MNKKRREDALAVVPAVRVWLFEEAPLVYKREFDVTGREVAIAVKYSDNNLILPQLYSELDSYHKLIRGFDVVLFRKPV